MKKFWKFSKHFAERFVERFDGDTQKIKKIASYFNNNVLQCVFECQVYGTKQRVKIGDYTVCYVWDSDCEQIVITTTY